MSLKDAKMPRLSDKIEALAAEQAEQAELESFREKTERKDAEKKRVIKKKANKK